jgi:hypothetical protein
LAVIKDGERRRRPQLEGGGSASVKWVFLLAVVMLAPAVFGWIHSDRRNLIRVCFLFGASILLAGPTLWSAPVAWPTWPAPIKGTEISFIDSVALALFLSAPKVRIPSSIKISYLLLCFALLISTCVAYNRIAALFYVWEFLRTTLLFLAMARVCASEPRAAIAFISGLCVGMIGEGFWVGLQYLQHAERPGGSFGHSNTMGIAADFAIFPALALVLGIRRALLPSAAVVSGLVCAVLGGSRASMGLVAAGIFLTVILSIVQKPNPRKYAVLGVMTLLVMAAAPAMIWSVGQRDSTASSDNDRAAMKDAASMIIADHPFGVGANQYVIIANTGGYSERAGVPWNEANLRAPVHDSYYLVTAELGYLGLAGMLAMLGSFIALGFNLLRRGASEECSVLVPGLLATAIIVAVQISYEFTFMEFMLHDLCAINAGILVALLARKRVPSARAAKIPARPAALSHAS